FEQEIAICRGDLLVSENSPLQAQDQFQVYIVWMSDDVLVSGRHFVLQSTVMRVKASITKIKHQVDISTFAPIPAQELPLNGIGLCNIKLERSILGEPYHINRDLGSFILIDIFNNQTVGAGMIHHALQRSGNIPLQILAVNKQARSQLKSQKP